MEKRSVYEFVGMLKERNYPVEGMKMEVLFRDARTATEYLGCITFLDDRRFSMKWNCWHCFLAMFADLNWKWIFTRLIPYVLNLKKEQVHDVDGEYGKTLLVLRTIK